MSKTIQSTGTYEMLSSSGKPQVERIQAKTSFPGIRKLPKPRRSVHQIVPKQGKAKSSLMLVSGMDTIFTKQSNKELSVKTKPLAS